MSRLGTLAFEPDEDWGERMTAFVEPDLSVTGVLGAARGGALATDSETVGTEHLLAGVTGTKGAARDALAAEGATKTALFAVLRDRAGRDDAWANGDDARNAIGARELLGDDADRRVRFTGAARDALTTAMGHARRDDAASFDAAHLLCGLLEGENRAVELLSACGVSPNAVLVRLDGGAGSPEDDLPPLLHATRDVVLGRGHYRHLSFWKRWLVKNTGVNLASRPAQWVGMETYEQAHRLGDGVVGTEHVLLAVLATHEVALRYPHLARERAAGSGTRYSGGERLAHLGVDYASVHRAVTGNRVPLTDDARPVAGYLGRGAASGDAMTDPGTGPLVDTLLNEKTRARQLVEALTAGA
ncbi:ClpA/ClpB-like protein [Stackebrandtia albiflava]|uniref:ClpA/ClpB-like protein n=2 Tax=Stackebrandtia albiflava TaxID=406432 RepID=A0A562V490_9ACTN|nr:ClpA/ClpB-like protein [Stackebrandtia albiflava]